MTEQGKYLPLLRRELQEYRNSLVLAPLAMAGIFIFLLALSVVFANRLTVVGNSLVEILGKNSAGRGVNITISIDEEQSPALDYPGEGPAADDPSAQEWDFGRDWTFEPQTRTAGPLDDPGAGRPVNMVLNGLHWVFLLVMLATSVNYLLGSLYNDRRDGSILFWKSMPVAEQREIAAKLLTACVLAPAIYLLASLFTQLCSAALAMAAVRRMDMSPAEVILANLDLPGLLGAQVGGMVIWVLWALPLYAWLLLCSAAARRSPLLLALAIPLALVVMEQLFLGSDHLSSAITAHVPQRSATGADSLGFYLLPPDWRALDYTGMLGGLLMTLVFLYAAVRLRRYRLDV